jgi:predicted secreted protein with PEFG-CTERM motif
VLLDEEDIDLVYEPGDTITISGSIDDVDNTEDTVSLSVSGPGTSDDDDTTHDDGEFEFEYEIENDAEDGIYTVEIEYDGDTAITYFMIDEETDDVRLILDDELYSQGGTVEISGEVDPAAGENEVEITIQDPEGNDDLSTDIELDGDEYSDEVDLDDDAVHGKYAVTAIYDDEEGYAIFEVEEDSGGSGSGDITATVTDTTVAPGDEVEITGNIDEGDIEGGAEVILRVEDPEDDLITELNDSVEPDSDTGDFDFSFELDEDADTGVYTVILSYEELDDKELTFTVSTSTGGGSSGGGSGSGSSSGLTARLSKTSALAGEAITVTGVVPRINSDELVNIVVLKPNGAFVGVSVFPEPTSDKTYSGILRLPSTLEEDEDYTVVVGYDNKEVRLNFDVTGKATGSTGAITVKTDKTSYSTGSTVVINGQIADDIFVEGQQVALQVYNPENAAYRFDPIEPEDDGSYSYELTIGGRLAISGEWDVKVTYNKQSAETTFDLTGGPAASPTYDLKVEDQTFAIKYESDGTINSMYVRPAEKKLVVAIDADADGSLTITLPREVIDAVQGGTDTKYIVTTFDTETGDETQIDITESLTNAQERTIVIDYDEGTDLIEIQGTNVVPEFGVLSALLLAIAIFSIIAVTTKFSNKFSAFRQW